MQNYQEKVLQEFPKITIGGTDVILQPWLVGEESMGFPFCEIKQIISKASMIRRAAVIPYANILRILIGPTTSDAIS